ncbi:MAG: 3-isopropylmalate dehydratase large subunit [Candidatus Dormibacteraeota bacterium]|uniref:3-isopropylmalate dehydratase large subunit n=1 Tax=Candidatus Amunia macphersoniae TaxID=3127014 RepID=A0A934KEF0_9BACT|nr:3-isopropylmalate dehydratase large subunit [Candidatus Dormibacteraeota bacterium]
MGTLVEEIIGNRLGRSVSAGDTVVAPVDCAFAHDVTAPLAIEAFERMEMPLHDPQRVVLVFDHVMPAATVAAAELHQRIRRFAADHQVRNLFAEGICHIIMVERGYARPGGIVVGADSHSTTYGGLGCFSTGMGSTDVGVILATGRTWFRVPQTLRVEVTGELRAPLTAKDVALHVLGSIGGDGADYMAVEWGGETVARMTLDQRLTLANMAADMGGKTGLCEVDETTLEGTTPIDGVPIPQPRSPRYADTLHVDVTHLQPQIAMPPAADNVHDIADVAGTPIDEVYIGSCTNGRLEDMEVIARYLSGHTVHPNTRTVVVPASRRIYTEALRRGWIETIVEAGALVMNPGCGPCLGRQHGVVAAGERVVSTSNRNYPGRMGSPHAEIYLTSPAVAAATAVAGCITDPRSAR